jgi:hypothetical protein
MIYVLRTTDAGLRRALVALARRSGLTLPFGSQEDKTDALPYVVLSGGGLHFLSATDFIHVEFSMVTTETFLEKLDEFHFTR